MVWSAALKPALLFPAPLTYFCWTSCCQLKHVILWVVFLGPRLTIAFDAWSSNALCNHGTNTELLQFCPSSPGAVLPVADRADRLSLPFLPLFQYLSARPWFLGITSTRTSARLQAMCMSAIWLCYFNTQLRWQTLLFGFINRIVRQFSSRCGPFHQDSIDNFKLACILLIWQKLLLIRGICMTQSRVEAVLAHLVRVMVKIFLKNLHYFVEIRFRRILTGLYMFK